jgi:hypothetical protein
LYPCWNLRRKFWSSCLKMPKVGKADAAKQ